ncbi:ExbD/TolR family protein [Sphingobium nicotianae]|uniref:Biopolymer transporter ExbD n=1 Tax=Sphingobium nicotianae TaxID=2782607 RepID=A0A9X1IQ74_9SPHN|nr:biopolymer transporter ExbD [Sphingobium nicotianae]MBT2186406.1 biopolymer transporter ExbD [Sphingobium nicotianae]
MTDRFLDARPISDLNTTPLIDVLLVLLVMFILTIPLQTHKVGIDLPASAPTRLQPDTVRNRITIDGASVIRWNGAAVSEAQLRTLLRQSMTLAVEPALDLQPEANARYVVVDAVMADIKRAGVTKLGLPGNEAYGAF